MVLIIFSNRRVCCGNALIPAPTIMQLNFSLESVSETTLSAVYPRSTRQPCTSYPKSISLLFVSVLPPVPDWHPIQWRWISWDQLTWGQYLSRGLFSWPYFLPHFLMKLTYTSRSPILLCPLDAKLFGGLVP